MNKILIEEKKEDLKEMTGHRQGKKVKRVSGVMHDDANFCIRKAQFDELLFQIDKPVRNIRALRKLLTEPGVFGEIHESHA